MQGRVSFRSSGGMSVVRSIYIVGITTIPLARRHEKAHGWEGMGYCVIRRFAAKTLLVEDLDRPTKAAARYR